MANLVKSNKSHLLSNVLADFWNAEDFFNKPLLANDLFPSVNVLDNDHSYELEVSAPGYKKEDFQVTINKGMLTISAKTKTENEETKENYTRKEFSKSSFSRSFSLPENVVAEAINASYKDGLLQVVLKKTDVPTNEIKHVKVD